MLLEARDLHIGYGDATAVWDVSLDVGAGEIVAVIGPNGAGKTTLINAIAGLLRCRRGELRFDGADGVHPLAWQRQERAADAPHHLRMTKQRQIPGSEMDRLPFVRLRLRQL